jgi:NADH-quinone oxidoreductase subunit C
MSQAVVKRLAAKFESEVLETHTSKGGDDTVVLKRDRLREIAQWLRDDPKNAFNLMRDVTVVDYQGFDDGAAARPRFGLTYVLYSIPKKHSLVLKVPLEEDDPTSPSLAEVWRAANWGEREAWDMYGIRFEGHPDLRRILLYEEFEGHPLRKDYDKRKSQPRLDLLAPERDAISEYTAWAARHEESGGDSESEATPS